MFVLPIGHDSMRVDKLPFVTLTIIAICLLAHFPIQSRIKDDIEAETATVQRALRLYSRAHYLTLPPAAVELLGPTDRQLYTKERKWLSGYDEDPDAAAEFVKAHSTQRSRKKGTGLSNLVREMQAMTGMQDNTAFAREAGLSFDLQKTEFLAALIAVDDNEYSDRHDEMDDVAFSLEQVRQGSILRRLGYVPADTRILSVVTHQFLHGGLVHLLFNMLFLWLAAVKLEDIWPHWFFGATYLALGVIAALVHGWTHPGSLVPMIGASGAVAGLMGIFLVRFARVHIRFFYIYWAFSLRPRKGTFDAPAYLMLPLWFGGELFSALFLDFGAVAYWSHVGGFAAGVVVGLALHYSTFEENVLGVIVDTTTPATPRKTELVAFRNQGKTAPAGATSDYALPRLDLEEMQLSDISADGLLGSTLKTSGQTILVPPDALAFLAVGRIDHIDPAEDRIYFQGGIPHAPAWVLTLFGPLHTQGSVSFTRGYLLDGAKVKHGNLFGEELPSSHQNLAALAKRILDSHPKIRYIHGPGPRGPHNLPIYVDFAQFRPHVARSIRALSGENSS